MSTKQKVLLVLVAVVIVALFVVAVAGRHPGDGNPGGHNGFVDWLGKLGGKQAGVPAADVSTSCPRQDRTVTVPGVCTLHVADPKSLKLLVLRSSAPFQVTAPAPGRADYTATDTAKVKDGVAELKVAVDKETDVVVACTCAVILAG
jgi:hypothetical protein